MTPRGKSALQWIVGCSLADSQGALEWIGWLHEHGAIAAAEAVAVCVVEEHALLPSHGMTRERIVLDATGSLRAAIDGSPARDAIGEIAVAVHTSLHDALWDQARARGAALVIGRRARRGEQRVVRLGKTARRVLRELPGPVVLVPPDLRKDELGNGPVIVALDTRDETMAAVRFGERLASAIDRPLLLAHVLSVIDLGLGSLSSEAAAEVRDRHEARERAAFSAYLTKHELAGRPIAILAGPPIELLSELAARERAPIIVCGARRRGDIVTASVASELAANGSVPIAIVPPDPQMEPAA